ncbi:MAG: arylesterase [Hydrogenophaga sp.]|uniref:Arylesterase n=1 Tax=Hydrogenophaga crocea TaxID=2716225 RepID=A0A6G8IG79_9BURK|nr:MULTISPECIES: arylesterase [Hydrogenophaga]MBL0946019.1 arylesterase [Hydrogenophaga sp.]QIM52187.1 arylesterase [Hydrogenophaga crocea]
MKQSLYSNRRDFSLSLLAALALGPAGPLHAQGKAPPVVLVVGDSLSAEYGLRRGSGWVALTEQKLADEKLAARVVNASVSGDTTSGGRSRLPALLQQHRPRVVVIELGGNDALRGLPLSMTRENLAAMARAAKAAGARVLLLGMDMPPNYGASYAKEFRELFVSVAREEKAALVPFFLKGVADLADPLALFQSDRIHPNEKAQPIMRDTVWPELRKLVAAG